MIVLQFIAMGDAASRLIQTFERGWPSHVDIVLADGSLLGARSDAIGGKPAGVQIRPAGYEKFEHVQRVSLTCTSEQETKLLNFLEAQIGKPYDKLAIAAFPFRRDWREDDSWFCSELAAAALEAAGWFPKPLANSVNEITPRDLLLILSPWDTTAAPTSGLGDFVSRPGDSAG